jgi:hypothetical protein
MVMSLRHRRRFALVGFLACLLALAALMVAVPAGAETDKPDYRTNTQSTVTPHVENTVCGDFSPAELVFTGRSHARYSGWFVEEPLIGVQEEGWIDIDVATSAAGHEYRIHQRYFHPRQFREFIYGYAVTVIKRDDGATMQGDSVLFLDPLAGEVGEEKIDWLETPTCTPPKH